MVVMLCSYSATANTTLILSTCSLLFFSQFLVIFFFSCLAWLSFPFYFLLFRQTQQNVVQLSTRCCEMVNITFFARKMLFSLKRWLVCFSFYAIVVSTFSSWAICISIMRAAFPEKKCHFVALILLSLVDWYQHKFSELTLLLSPLLLDDDDDDDGGDDDIFFSFFLTRWKIQSFQDSIQICGWCVSIAAIENSNLFATFSRLYQMPSCLYM